MQEGHLSCLLVDMYAFMCISMCVHGFEEFLVAGHGRSLNLSSGSTGETREYWAAEGRGINNTKG